MVFLKGKKEMALIYKPCIHPQMKAKCCHDLLYSSSQRANWGELNHHTAHGEADPAVSASGKAVKAAPWARPPGYLEHHQGWRRSEMLAGSRHLVGHVPQKVSEEHVSMERGIKTTSPLSIDLSNNRFGQA